MREVRPESRTLRLNQYISLFSNRIKVLSSGTSLPALFHTNGPHRILIPSVFLGVGYVIAKFFHEASVLATMFLVVLVILTTILAFVA